IMRTIDPEGVAEQSAPELNKRLGPCMGGAGWLRPFQGRCIKRHSSGGFASLNHRLMSVTPPGSVKKRAFPGRAFFPQGEPDAGRRAVAGRSDRPGWLVGRTDNGTGHWLRLD